MSKEAWDGWYDLARWRRRRRLQLIAEPLCRMCLERGVVIPATIADHIDPHKGDRTAFELGALQSLCKLCHDSRKRVFENRGFLPDVGPDGWPLDPRHPVYGNKPK